MYRSLSSSPCPTSNSQPSLIQPTPAWNSPETFPQYLKTFVERTLTALFRAPQHPFPGSLQRPYFSTFLQACAGGFLVVFTMTAPAGGAANLFALQFTLRLFILPQVAQSAFLLRQPEEDSPWAST